MRLIARYAKEKSDSFEVITVFDKKTIRENIDKKNPSIKSISKTYPSAIWFERKMSDDFGIMIEDAFDTRELIHHERFPKNIFPLRKDFTKKELEYDEYKPYNYETIGGDSVFQVAIGPIHAGIIEPGHFQFSQSGERMLHLEVRHFYKNRAIEKILEGKTLNQAKPIIERISANESIAYQICLRDIILKATNQELPNSLKRYHAILLEIEMIIHHLTDIGFIPNDAGFGSALAYASKLSEDARRIMQSLTNHRFGFDAIKFETIIFDKLNVFRWLDKLEKDIKFFEDWISDIPSLWDRFDTTGVLESEDAKTNGAVGVVARASGIEIDTRVDEFYLKHKFKLATQKSGDVGARFKVRLEEIKNSIKLIREFSIYNIDGMKLSKAKDGEYESFTENSLGELYMSIDIKDGVIERFFARDPSFINWQALHLMMLKDIIADFPLINKSCDLSYAGNDL